MQIVPLNAVASQQLQVTLGGQACQLNLYEKSTGLFMDVLVSGSLIIGGVICLNRTVIVRDAYLGFIGDFAFVDTQGADFPVFTGLGTRFLLCYLTPVDLATNGLPA
jgi:hypothetical protein